MGKTREGMEMQGTWSMVFRGQESSLAKVLAGAESLREDPRQGRFCKELRAEGKTLRAGGTWKHAILGLAETLEALHRFAPEAEAACRSMLEEYCYIDYLALEAETPCFTEMKRAGIEEYEGESSGIDYEEVELPGEQGKSRVWKVEKSFRVVLNMWDTW